MAIAGLLALLVAGLGGVAAAAEELPADKRVTLDLGSEGFIPVSIAAYRPLTSEILPLDVDRDGQPDHGFLRATDGRNVAALVFASGTEELWGPVVFYMVVSPTGQIVEWAGDPPWRHDLARRP